MNRVLLFVNNKKVDYFRSETVELRGEFSPAFRSNIFVPRDNTHSTKRIYSPIGAILEGSVARCYKGNLLLTKANILDRRPA